jgi:hypothetical protein
MIDRKTKTIILMTRVLLITKTLRSKEKKNQLSRTHGKRKEEKRYEGNGERMESTNQSASWAALPNEAA